MPRFTVHASNFPFGVPHKRLGTIEAPTQEQAETQAKLLYPGASPIVQPEGRELEASPSLSPGTPGGKVSP